MTRPMTITLAVVVLASTLALAQNHGTPNAANQDSPGVWTASTKALTVAGRVSDDGKHFVTDIDTEWTINNPDSLKGREGRLVTIKCYVDSDKSKIQVLSVKTDVQYSAMYRDSAFRR
jgi:hypothetical protein